MALLHPDRLVPVEAGVRLLVEAAADVLIESPFGCAKPLTSNYTNVYCDSIDAPFAASALSRAA